MPKNETLSEFDPTRMDPQTLALAKRSSALAAAASQAREIARVNLTSTLGDTFGSLDPKLYINGNPVSAALTNIRCQEVRQERKRKRK